jgi:hypothetical protein
MWKSIEDYPKYEVNEYGDVRNVKTGKLLKSFVNHRGYLRINLNGKSKFIHRLIAEYFIPNPDNKPQINHINGNKLDNRIENLEWTTNSENMLHAYKTGLRKVYKINQYTKNGIFLRQYDNAEEASELTGVHKGSIRKVCIGMKSHITAGGFKWKYDEEV